MSWPDGKIATQCLFKGGKAVYRARQYVQLFNDSIDFDNEIECSNQGYYRQVTDISNKTYISVSIIPNPTKDIATVILTGEDEGICDVQITNTLGQEKLKFKFNCKERENILIDILDLK